jgi:uncharacterized membrane protein
MISVNVSVDVARPPREVFEYLEDAENNPAWIPNMRSCRWTTPPPVGVGSKYEQTSAFLGRQIRTNFEVTEHAPGQRVTIESREGSSFPIRVTRIVEAGAGGGSHVIEEVEGDASGFYSIARPLLKAMVARNIRRDYRNLKRVLERARADQ